MSMNIGEKSEPALFAGLLEAAFLALIPGLVYAFGWSDQAQTLIVAAVGPLIALLVAFWVRARVSPSA